MTQNVTDGMPDRIHASKTESGRYTWQLGTVVGCESPDCADYTRSSVAEAEVKKLKEDLEFWFSHHGIPISDDDYECHAKRTRTAIGEKP